MENKKFLVKFIPRASFYLWFIFILIVTITFLNWKVAIPGYALLIILVYYNFRTNYIRSKEITKYIENLTFNINSATKDTLLNFPMPLVVIELDGTIIWYNSSFKNIFKGQQLLEKEIDEFVEGLEPSSLVNSNGKISKEVFIGERSFVIYGNYIKIDDKIGRDEYILMLYLIDNTEFVELKKRYSEEKTCIGLVVIDNFEDLMLGMEDSLRPQMLAETERRIVQWMTFTGGILKKLERDKYIFIFETKYLKELEEKKFEILDTVKEISVGNKIPVTLSIGFGINSGSPALNFKAAAASIDIALGRGGDQVVIKDGDNFSFYGGKTRELERRTRVKARVIAYAIRELIDQAPHVLIMGHENGDLDSLGASLGLSRIVRNRGKKAYIVINKSNASIDKLMEKIGKSPEYDGLFIDKNQALGIIERNSLLVVVDTHRAVFTECPELLNKTKQVVVIDHHRRGTDFISDAVLSYQEPYASSTSEMVTEILQYIEENISLEIIEAEALYSGIVVDTKNFTFKTGVRTFEAASFLRRQGVDTVTVRQFFQNDIETYNAISSVVQNAEVLSNNMAISLCPPDIKNPQLISSQAADQLLTLTGIAAAFVLCMADDEIWISGRSFGDINVQIILEKLGGGGHLTVAGAQLSGMTMEEAKEKLIDVLEDYMESE